MPARLKSAPKPGKNKSLDQWAWGAHLRRAPRARRVRQRRKLPNQSWIWDAACSVRGAKDAPKYKDYILPLIFTKRRCDVFDDEINRIAAGVGSRKKSLQLTARDHKLVCFYLPLVPEDTELPVWSVIRKLSSKIGEGVISQMRAVAKKNPLLQGTCVHELTIT